MPEPSTVLFLTLFVEMPPTFSTEEADALLAACTRARAPEVCERKANDTRSPLVARVDLSERHAQIEVTFDDGKRRERVFRELSFEEQDTELERARALGLLLALLSKPLEPEAVAEPQEEKAVAATPSVPKDEAKPSALGASHPWLWSAGLAARYDASLGTVHLGPRLLIGYELTSSWRAEAYGEISAYPSVGGLAFLEGRALAGLAFRPKNAIFEPFALLGASLLDVHEGGSDVHASRLTITFDLGLHFEHSFNESWRLRVSPYCAITPMTTNVSFGSEPVASTALLEPGLALDLAFRP